MNKYPSLFFDHTCFKQLVLKCLFLNMDLRHLVGVEQRMTEDILDSANDYFRERQLADRPLPTSSEFIKETFNASF